MDWTMNHVATHFIQFHPIHSAPMVTGLQCNSAILLVIWHYVTRQFNMRALDMISATKSKQNNRLTKPKQLHSNQGL